MGAGGGLPLPALTGVPRTVKGDRAEVVAAQIALTLDQAGVLPRLSWPHSGSPAEYLDRALGMVSDRVERQKPWPFALETTLVFLDDEPFEHKPEEWCLALHFESTGAPCLFTLGRAFERLRRVHASMPATVLHLIEDALNRWFFVYDRQNTYWDLENEREWAAEEDAYERDERHKEGHEALSFADTRLAQVPTDSTVAPRYLDRHPLRSRKLLRYLFHLSPQSFEARLIAIALQLHSQARTIDVRKPSRSARAAEALERSRFERGDGDDIPLLLLHFATGDTIERCWDQRAETAGQNGVEAQLLLPFALGEPDSIREAFARWRTALTVLDTARQLYSLLGEIEKADAAAL